MTAARTKLVYLAPLERGVDHQTFRDRWRGHGELAMSLPQWRYVDRYELDPAVIAADGGGASLTAGYGGIGMLWIGDMPEFTAALDDGAGALLYRDELRVFGGLLGDNLRPTREEVVFDAAEPRFKLVVALWRVPSLSRDEFSQRWSAEFARVTEPARSQGRACRCVLNHTESDDPDCIDGFLELGFETHRELKGHLGDPQATEYGEIADPVRSVVVPVSVNTVFDGSPGS
jgi:hypothetical protein